MLKIVAMQALITRALAHHCAVHDGQLLIETAALPRLQRQLEEPPISEPGFFWVFTKTCFSNILNEIQGV